MEGERLLWLQLPIVPLRKTRGLVLFACSFLLLAGFASTFALGTVVFGIQPPTIQANAGQSFNVTVSVLSGGTGSTSLSFGLSYDNSTLMISQVYNESSWRLIEHWLKGRG